MFLTSIAAYVIAFVVSLIYTCIHLSKPGISKESGQLILKRHVMVALVYFVSNLYILGTGIMQVMPAYFNKWNGQSLTNDWWAVVLKIMFGSQGFTIPLLRLNEPYFFAIVKHKIKKW